MQFDSSNYAGKCLALMASLDDKARAQAWMNVVAKRGGDPVSPTLSALAIPFQLDFVFKAGAVSANLEQITDGFATTEVHTIVKSADWSVFIGTVEIGDNGGDIFEATYTNAAAKTAVTAHSDLDTYSWNSVIANLFTKPVSASDKRLRIDGVILTYTS